MEGKGIVEVALCELHEVINGDRCLVSVELSLHITLLGRDNSVFHSVVFVICEMFIMQIYKELARKRNQSSFFVDVA